MGTAAGDPAGFVTGGLGQASPLISRLLVGAALRRLRVDQGFSYEDAGEAIGAPISQISLLERGETSYRMRDMVGLCALYGVTDQDQRVTLLGLARRANRPEWWHPYRDLIPGWFERYLGLEQAASLIRNYEVQFIPELLQLPHYARALLEPGWRTSARRDIERRVELQVRRQDILHRLQPAHFWTVIDEAALRRPVGGRAVMRTQLHHLLQVCDMPHVTLQVLPFSLGGHPASGGPVTVLRLPDQQLGDVVYLEQLTTAAYLGSQSAADYYRHVMNQLSLQAISAGSAQDILARILRDT